MKEETKKEIIKLERKMLRYCLKKINRIDLANNLDLLSDKDIHDIFLKIYQLGKEEKICLNVQNKC